jgi:ABC-2 type transport system permease protein
MSDVQGGAAAGYRPSATLRLRVEVRRQIGRRRTQLSLGFLAILPLLLAGAFELGSAEPDQGAPVSSSSSSCPLSSHRSVK